MPASGYSSRATWDPGSEAEKNGMSGKSNNLVLVPDSSRILVAVSAAIPLAAIVSKPTASLQLNSTGGCYDDADSDNHNSNSNPKPYTPAHVLRKRHMCPLGTGRKQWTGNSGQSSLGLQK